MEGLGACVVSEYDVTAMGELFGELVLIAGCLLFFQYADKGYYNQLSFVFQCMHFVFPCIALSIMILFQMIFQMILYEYLPRGREKFIQFPLNI